jgi:hypothetical protein
MTSETVLDKMAEVHFHEWTSALLSILPPGVESPSLTYAQLPTRERKLRREVMRPVLEAVVTAISDEVLVDSMNAGDIAMHQAADLSQRLDYWLDN